MTKLVSRIVSSNSEFRTQQRTMKQILIILFLISLTTGAFAKGFTGSYYIKGTAFNKNKTILKNVNFTVKIGSTIKTVTTDDNGLFEIEIHWENACPSLRTFEQHKCDNKKLNPEFIYISYEDKEIKLNNKWKKYLISFPKSKEKSIRKKDLNFD